jgi:hypothetical protein
MKLQMAKEAKGAGKGDEAAPQGTKLEPWTCLLCSNQQLPHHRFCEPCGWVKKADCLKPPKGKGKGKGQKGAWNNGGTGPKDAGDTAPAPTAAAAPAAAEATEVDPATVLAKTLLTMDLHPAPEVKDLKSYPRPALKPEAKSAETLAQAELSVTDLQDIMADGKGKFSADLLRALTKDLEAAKAALAKVKGEAPKGANLTKDFLAKRIAGAEAAAGAAEVKHKDQLKALDSQLLRLQEIRAHKVTDFSESQAAFAARLTEDKLALKEVVDKLGKLVADSEVTAMDTTDSILADLSKHFASNPTDLPACPDPTDPAVGTGLAALWHFYASDVFGSPPPVTFEQLGILPSFAHTLVGDKVWKGYWGAGSTTVDPTQHVPRTMHNVMKYIVEQEAQQLVGMISAKTEATKRHETASSLLNARRQASAASPY